MNRQFSQYTTIILLLFTVLFCPKHAFSQQYNFTNYTVESGLSQDQILAVCQDNEGVMWFGTNGGGITKYNGITYEYITDKNGLADNLIYTIVKDKLGRMWIGTNNGLTIIEGKKYKNYTVQNGLNHNRIFTVFFDSKGNTLLGTGKGVSIFKDTSFAFYPVSSELDSISVFNINEDSEHSLWFSTLGNGIFKYNGKSTVNYSENDGLPTNYAYSVMEYKKGVYWFLTVSGLSELSNGIVKPINPGNFKDVYAVNYYSFFKDDSYIWLSSNHGLIKIGKEVQQFTQKNGLLNNEIWKIYRDKENNLWLASKENGVSKLASQQFFMYPYNNGFLPGIANKILQSKDGRYWIGSDKGLTVINGAKVDNYNRIDWQNASNNVTAIAEDKTGNIWMSTGNEGLIKYSSKQFTRIKSNSNEKLNSIFDIYIDTKGEILLGTKDGMAKVINGKIEQLKWPGVTNGFVYNINQDNAGNYWIGTENGLFRWDGENISQYGEKHGFEAKQVYEIRQGTKRELWIATNAGIYKYDNNIFTQISESEGLSSNQIRSIAIDKDGTIWAGLPNGIDKIQVLENGKYNIRHYGVEDGFMGEVCMQNSILIDNQNKIWFGAQKGLMVYQPEYDKRNTLEPITRITDVRLFGGETPWKIYADSLDQYNLPVNLELNHDRNYLVFTYAGVSHTAPGKVRYKYMLKGLDKDWQAETSKTEVPYPNLLPGEYEFLVRATNGDGVWNKQPASFKFIISPPFWKTGWFYSLIIIIGLAGIFSYVRIRIQSRIIEEKNEELKHANLDIAGKNKNITDSITYAQRIQQSFLTSENELKKSLKDYFILYKPRDIVSGDFYWVFDMPDRVLVTCADSTGHGIPGAFMSLIGISLLNEISHSKKMAEPAAILDELRRIIICALNPEQVDEGGKDGMDLALISIFKPAADSNDVKIHYSGGNASVYIVTKNENNKSELIEYKADKQPVGFYSHMKPFSQKEITAKKGDIIYLCTDGFADQFGGPNGKKIMAKQLKTLFLNNADLPMYEQGQKLDTVFAEWKGDLEQVDDVTIFAIKLS